MENKKGEYSVTKDRDSRYELFPVAFCVVDSLDHVAECNDLLVKLTAHQKEDILGSEVSFLFREKGSFKEFVNRLIEKKEKQESFLTLLKSDNSEESVKIEALAQTDEEGAFKGYFLVITSIQEEVDKEEALKQELKEKKEQLKIAQKELEESEAVLGIRIKAKTRELRELNESLEEKVKERTRELEEKAAELEERAEDKEKAQTALLNLAEDAERSSQEAQQEKEKTMLIIKSFVDGLLFFDNNGILTFANPKAEEMFDVKLRDIEGRTIDELGTFPTIQPVINIVKQKKSGERRDVFREEVKMENETYLEVTVIPIKKKGQEEGLLVNIHDITREKGIEKIKSEFVSVAAHQLRTPLSGIKWTLQTILEEEEEVDVPQEIMDFIRKAYEANDRMVNLVNDLLNVSRIEEGRYAYEKEEVDFLETINQVVEDYKEHIEKKQLEFKVQKPIEKLPPVNVDKEKIMMVVQNFLDNAMKYTKEGSIELKIEKLDKEIRVSVTDTGVGIPEDQQKRMFNKFFRAANVQRMDTEGSGLGLFIAKNIVEAHSGKVGFSSTYGEGSTFYFVLPTEKEHEMDDIFKPL